MKATRWLSDDEQKVWRTYLLANQLLWAALDRQLQRDAGMPHAYYIILAMLSEAPNRELTMSELARVVSSSPSRLSHAVSRLEEFGWVRRRKHDTDGRTTVASLTDDGFAVLAAAAPGHVEEVRSVLFDPLTTEQVEQLGEIVAAIVAPHDGRPPHL
ncbi:MarR family winged helix-turn-helix transcriptional regulator [Jiangella anatolica]|uniref:MarR family transcriptional regulator n=1 Tax=Jiangella anatolica TaxID=2670374 RepID=A0A2W2BJI2_9ACTN|nr:MarR family transcriptional regulator [Jiangella anatolica]PZF80504.1 MarR family transcriptional regulator [Jiangella anatolica]